MKCLSVKQPHAQFFFDTSEPKVIETRPWTTKYEGDLLIVSSKEPDLDAMTAHGIPPFDNEVSYPRGVALGVVELYHAEPYRKDQVGLGRTHWRRGLHGLWVRRPRRLKNPFLVRGMLGIYEIPWEPKEDSFVEVLA